MDSARPGITRRTALRAAAWSAPVIAVAAASPLAAASGGTDETDLGVTMLIAPLSSLRHPGHEFALSVDDVNATGTTWAGSFDLEYFIAPDDSVVFIDTGASSFGVGTSSTSGWSYAGLGQSGSNGYFSVVFSFSGTITSGSPAVLSVTNPSYLAIGRSGPSATWPSSPYTTTRSVILSNVAGSPNSDTSTGNTLSDSVSYSW